MKIKISFILIFFNIVSFAQLKEKNIFIYENISRDYFIHFLEKKDDSLFWYKLEVNKYDTVLYNKSFNNNLIWSDLYSISKNKFVLDTLLIRKNGNVRYKNNMDFFNPYAKILNNKSDFLNNYLFIKNINSKKQEFTFLYCNYAVSNSVFLYTFVQNFWITQFAYNEQETFYLKYCNVNTPNNTAPMHPPKEPNTPDPPLDNQQPKR